MTATTHPHKPRGVELYFSLIRLSPDELRAYQSRRAAEIEGRTGAPAPRGLLARYRAWRAARRAEAEARALIRRRDEHWGRVISWHVHDATSKSQYTLTGGIYGRQIH